MLNEGSAKENKSALCIIKTCTFSSVGRATDSYSVGPRFESVKVHQWPIGQVVKTAASHAVNIGSNPVWVTKEISTEMS